MTYIELVAITGAMLISIALHIIGLTLWLGTLILISRLVAVVAADFEKHSGLVPFLSRAFKGYGFSGLALTLITGVYQLANRGVGFYMKQGWFHTKLTLVIVLLIVTAVLGASIAQLKRGETFSKGRGMALHGIAALCLVVIVFLTILGR